MIPRHTVHATPPLPVARDRLGVTRLACDGGPFPGLLEADARMLRIINATVNGAQNRYH